MKSILLLRHAKSSWDDPGLADFDRPLAKRGLRDAPRMGKALAKTNLHLDHVYSSPANRARSTARLVLESAGYQGAIDFDERIYHASVNELYSLVRDLPEDEETVMLVGHNPGFEDFASSLCAPTSRGASLRFPTAAMACFDVETRSWSNVKPSMATLQWFIIPKIL